MVAGWRAAHVRCTVAKPRNRWPAATLYEAVDPRGRRQRLLTCKEGWRTPDGLSRRSVHGEGVDRWLLLEEVMSTASRADR